MSRALLAVFLLGGALCGPGAALAGYVFVEDNGDETLLQRGRLRFKPHDAGAASVAMDLAGARMWMADPARRAYWEGSVEEFCAAARGALRQALGLGASPGGSDGARTSPRVAVERTLETETIAGLAARKYRILADGRLYEELWLSVDPAIVRELDPARASEALGRMMACMLDAGPGGGLSGVEDDPEYRKLYLAGWPLKSVYHGVAGLAGRSAVVRAERRDLNDADFAPPAGLRRVPLGELLGLDKR